MGGVGREGDGEGGGCLGVHARPNELMIEINKNDPQTFAHAPKDRTLKKKSKTKRVLVVQFHPTKTSVMFSTVHVSRPSCCRNYVNLCNKMYLI